MVAIHRLRRESVRFLSAHFSIKAHFASKQKKSDNHSRAVCNRSAMNSDYRVIDAAVHVWKLDSEYNKSCESSTHEEYYPFAADLAPPSNCFASPELLLQQMDDNQIFGALLVQPINYKFDHSFITSVLSKYTDRFGGCLLANPSTNDDLGSGVRAMEQLVKTNLFHAVRFNPYLWPSNTSGSDDNDTSDDDRGMANAEGLEMYRKAGELNLPVGVMCFNGILPLEKQLITLLETSPKTIMILDHFGFAGKGDKNMGETSVNHVLERDEWKFVLNLATRYSQVYVKLSAFDRQNLCFNDNEDETNENKILDRYHGVQLLIRDAVEKIGANRCMFGTDFPFCNDDGNISYSFAKKMIENSGISEEEIEWVMGKTVCQLMPRAWTSKNS